MKKVWWWALAILFATTAGEIGCSSTSSGRTPTQQPTSTPTITSTYTPVCPTWILKGSMVTARNQFATAALTCGGVAGLLAVGGVTAGSFCAASAEFYNPQTDTWGATPPLPATRHGHAAAPVTRSGVTGVLVAGGVVGGSVATSVQFFDPSAGGWTPLTAMTTGRVGLVAAPVVIGGVAGVLAAGGVDGGGFWLGSAEFYDPAGSWTVVASMTTPRSEAAAAPVTFGGVAGVLVAGGGNPGGALSSAEFYNPVANTWQSVSPMAVVREDPVAAPVTVGGVQGVLVAGGANSSGPLPWAEFYDPSTNSWSAISSMNLGRYAAAAAPVTIGGRLGVLVSGGYLFNGTGRVLSETEFFCP